MGKRNIKRAISMFVASLMLLGIIPGMNFGVKKVHAVATTNGVTNVSSSTANGTYKIGDTISISVTFSSSVTVTGTPRLVLETGITDRVASYSSGSGTYTVTFIYTVQPGDTTAALDYTSANALSLNGGTIKDFSTSQDAVLTLPSPGTAGSLGLNKNLIIDGKAPSVSSIFRDSALASTTNATSVGYTVVFDEAVTGVDTFDFSLVATGSAAGAIASITGSGITYTVTVNSITGNGTLRLDLKSSETGIVDAAGNAIVGGYTSGQSYTIDTTAPAVSFVAVPANGTYNIGQSLDFIVNFSENVTIKGTDSTLSLNIGGTTRHASFVSKTANSVTYSYTVQNGDLDTDGISIGDITLNTTTIRDGSSNDAVVVLNGVGATTGVLIDAVPKITITSQPSNANVNQGNNTSFTVVATGTGLSYKWEVNRGSGFINVVNGAGCSGATTATLNIIGAKAVMNGYVFRCIVTGANMLTTTSNDAILTVNIPIAKVTNVALSALGVATWDNVSNASYYEVQLYKDDVPQGTAVTKASDTISHDFLSEMRAAGAGVYTVKVTAKGDGSTYTDGPQSEASGSQTIAKLGTVTGLTWSGDVAHWTSVANAASYEVQLYKKGIALNGPVNVSSASVASGVDFTSSIAADVAANKGGIYTYKVTAKADTSTLFVDGDQSAASNDNIKGLSSDATLSGLSISSGAFNESFEAGRIAYTASVGNRVSSITVTPTVNESHATVTVAGSAVTNGQPSSVVLNVGANPISVEVTAQDGTTKTYTITVTRAAAPYIPPYIPPVPQPTTETRQVPVVVKNGNQQTTAVQTTITRTTDSDGSKKDTVVLDESTVTATVKKALETKTNSAAIVITDIPGNNTDKTEVHLPGASMTQLASNNMDLTLQTEKVSLEMSAATVSELKANDLKVQISEEKDSNKIAENKGMILKIASGSKIIASPLNIEANITGRVKLTIPIDSSRLPSSKEELDKFLSSLAVAIHHSDGQYVVDKGTLVYDEKGNVAGIAIWVDKFSSFTIINLPTTYFQGKTTIMKDKVAANKEWQIKFTKPVDSATVVKDNVYVVDSSGNTMESRVIYTSDNILKVAPVNSYKSGETYYLYITKGVEAKDKTSLVNGLRYQFTVK